MFPSFYHSLFNLLSSKPKADIVKMSKILKYPSLNIPTAVPNITNSENQDKEIWNPLTSVDLSCRRVTKQAHDGVLAPMVSENDQTRGRTGQ